MASLGAGEESDDIRRAVTANHIVETAPPCADQRQCGGLQSEALCLDSTAATAH